jgi:glycosyltransferase involved in cell wall biosynthesis
MTYNVVFYCPDNHIQYNRKTLDEVGVGGGITARIRIAHALETIGNRVILFVNCPQNEVLDGVEYRHFTECKQIKADVLVVSTSGGKLDLGIFDTKVADSKLKVLMVSGSEFPKNISLHDFDYIYTPSNFISRVVIENWGSKPDSIFCVNYGVNSVDFAFQSESKHDLHKLVYFSHPSKGLDSAIAVFRQLKQMDANYSLHIFGSAALWGEEDSYIPDEDGITCYGLMGQRVLAQQLQQMGFSINLQSRLEPFGIVIVEAMKVGCIVLASDVGAYPEIIQHGYNGFIIPGNHNDPETHERAVSLINHLITHPDYLEYVRRNAVNSPFSWETVAKTWEGHWDWHFGKAIVRSNSTIEMTGACELCFGALLMLADGLHCTQCGHYQKSYRF